MNSARPMKNLSKSAHSTVKWPIHKNTTFKNSNFNQRVNTVKDKKFNTARPKEVVNGARPKGVVNAVKGNNVNVVKASACWVWKPKTKDLDHVSKHNSNPQIDLQDQGVIDSGCSRHITGNMSYLTNYEEIDGGYVAFGGNPKGWKITGKGTIKTGNLDFENVYFLTDESQVLLKVPRKNNMYSVDLKNIIPKGGLTCLFSKATSDESELWHRRLGYINFKTMNKLVEGNLVRGLQNFLKIIKPVLFVKRESNIKLLVTPKPFSWVLFLATKDEKSFITRVENQIDQRVKVIRCDNGTEFKNKEMNQFCKRKADSKLPTTFCAEAVNTACYVQNRVLVTKPHNKTPYELFLGRKPTLGFMRPFGCPVTILNTIDHLGKFDGKADEGFFVGYSINRSGPNWLFDIDALTKLMNYKTVVVGNQSNGNAGTKACDDAGKARMETIPGKDYILLPLWTVDPPFCQSSKSSPDAGFKPLGDDEKKVTEEPGKEGGDPSKEDERDDQEKDASVSSTNNVNDSSTNEVNAVGRKESIELPDEPNMLALEDIVYSDDDEDVGAEVDMNNLDAFMHVSPISTTKIHKDLPVEQIIGDLNSAPQTRRMIKNLEDYAGASLDRKSTTEAKTVNGEVQLQALVDGKKIIVTEASVRRDLQLNDDRGNINKTQSKEILNEPSSIGTSSGSVPRCLETIGDIIAQTRFENISKTSNDPLLARGNTLRSGEDSLKLKELMELCTDLQTRVLDLETTKTTKANEITSLKRRFKKLERRNKSRTHGLKRIYRVGLSRRVESSKDEGLGEKDASKQGRIDDIDANKDIYLVNVHTDEDMFGVNDLDGDEVIVDNEDVVKTAEETRSVVEEVIAVIEKAKLVSAAEETVNDVPQTTSDGGRGGGKGGGGGGGKSGGGGGSKGDGGGGKCGGGSTRGGGGSSGKSGGGSGSMKASDSDVSSRKYYRYSGSLTILMLSQNVAWAIVNKGVRYLAIHDQQVDILNIILIEILVIRLGYFCHYCKSREILAMRILPMMDDPNITLEQYIRLEEEKAQKRGKVFNWETARYGKIWYDEDVHDVRSVETEFLAIVFNDNLTSNETPSCKPTVSSLNNNKIDFRISSDESDDEDYTTSLKDFENEFQPLVYNVSLSYKSDFSTEPHFMPQHIVEFDLKDETSLSEYDEVKQNVFQNRRDLPRDISLDSVVVLRYEKRSKSENKGKVPTEMELVLEQTQQGTSYEVSIRYFSWNMYATYHSTGTSDTDQIVSLVGPAGDLKINESVENKFPAIVFNDNLSSNETLSCEPTVSSLNDNEIDFKISFDESGDEDYTVVFDKNSFSYKIISTNDLKMDSENDNEKVNMPLFLSPEPSVSCIDDLDFFKDFENEFLAIFYNDDLTSKSDFLTESTLSPQYIDEFDLKNETSLSEYDEKEQNVYMAPLSPCDQRHLWLRFQVVGYTEEIVHDFEQRLETIFKRQMMSRRIGDEMGLDVAGTLCFHLGGARRSMPWRQFILALGLHTAEEMAEDGFRAYWLGSERVIPDKGDLNHYWVEISYSRDFLRGAPCYTYIIDPVRRLCHRLISYNISGMGHAPKKVNATNLFYLCSMDRGAANVLYLVAQYLFRHIEGRKSGTRLSRGHFIGRLAHHFGLVSDDGLRGLSVVARNLPLIDIGELVKLNICMEIRDNWAWVALGPERQPDAAAGALGAIEDAPAVDEGSQVDPTPVQVPQPPPPPPAAGRTMP
ncbi:retrovirus-related pol polyprotein from transposon TNT 1-94 [Tanacetum coccineum]|uniref:Retrovirus-related pol polyprotein from transposon TNT 1-94 n=1 Tax=Tanacetum coccineum TaxID=301880 RepID=A0ABQ5EKC3_9ASTR